MPTRNGKTVSSIPGLYLRSRDKTHDAVLEFASVNTAPTTASGYYYLYVDGGVLKFDDGSTTYNLLTGAGGGISSWDGLYASDTTLTIDGSTLALNGTHATNDVLTVTGAGTGAAIQITNSSTGADISGTSATWSISAAGAAVFVGITGCDTIVAAANLSLDATGTGTIGIGETSTGAVTITPALTCVASVTITGSADTDVLTLTAGDMLITAGQLTIAEDDTATFALNITTAGTTGGAIYITANDLAEGMAVTIDSDNEASFGTAGGYLNCYNGASNVFSVARYGAVVIAGNETTTVLTLTKGDLSIADGSLTIVDDDAAASLSVTNDSATTLGEAADTGVVLIHGELLSTGTLLELSLDETSLAGGYYLRCFGQDDAANFAGVFNVGEYGLTTITTKGNVSSLVIANSGATTADVVSITSTAQTTGDLVYLAQTAETFAAGEMLKIANTMNGDFSSTPKTGNLCSITSSVTGTNTATLDYDTLLISRSNIVNGSGKTLTAAGSALKVMVTSTDTDGTCTDTTVGIEVLTADGGTAAPTGDAVKITSVGVGAKALNIVSASTTVSDVLITGSGVKANNKACLEVVSTGATAAGGSLLRVASGASTPAAATSYLVDFDYSASTMTNNPVAVFINAGSSTAAGLQVTGSGASAGGLLELNSTATGAVGAVLKLDQTADSAADNDVIGRILFTAEDDTDAAETYARIDVIAQDVTAADPDASINFLVDRAGTVTLGLTVGWDDTAGAAINGIAVGDSAGAAIVTSNGTQNLILETNGGTDSSTITITDGTNGDITLAINGTGSTVIQNLTYETNAGSPVTTTATLVWGDAEGQVVFCTSAGGAYSITLPAAATVGAGGWYTFIKTDADANAITLDANASETIGEAGSAMATTYAVMDAIHDTVTLVCDGTSWYVTAQNLG